MGRSEFDIESRMAGHPLRRFIYNNPLSKFLTRHLTVGDILSEAFCGVWMASVSTGLIFGFTNPDSTEALVTMVIIAVMVNLTWGIIDGWTSVFSPMVDDADADRALRRLWSDPGDKKAEAWVDNELASGIGRNLDDGRREKVLATYVEAEPKVPANKVHKADREDIMVVLCLVIVEVLMALLIVLPYVLFPGESYSPILSRAIAITIAGAIAYWYAIRLNRPHPMIWVGFFIALMFVVVTLSWLFGW
jgi:hypothetical protein